MANRRGILSRRDLLAQGIALGGVAMVGPSAKLFGQERSATSTPQNDSANPFDDLRDHLRGSLVTPGDPTYDKRRQLWNGMIDKRPALIVGCAGASDVIAAVRYAQSNDLAISVQGGGHNVAGKALRDDALAIDLSPMKGIRVDPSTKSARANAGVTWGELDHETTVFGLATTGGTISTTGGGLTLGGGFGWLMRKHGLACDNLVAVDIVTADGELLTANESAYDDLFWAVRGGGGNFGVVTSFEYRLHELGTITAGMALYPPGMLKDMFRFYRDYTSKAPDTVVTMAGIAQGPPGTPLEGGQAGFISVCHSGEASDGERLVKPIKNFGPPAIDIIGVMPYTELQTLSDTAFPAGNRNYWRSNFLMELSDEAIDVILERADGMPPNAHSALFFEHLGGAIARVGPQETAFSNRDANFNFTILAGWSDPDKDNEYIPWTRSFGDAMKDLATGAGYVNYMTDDEGEARVRATYEQNYERLVAVKRKYDPANFFSGNQNIAP